MHKVTVVWSLCPLGKTTKKVVRTQTTIIFGEWFRNFSPYLKNKIRVGL